jgi:hypothetical protein
MPSLSLDGAKLQKVFFTIYLKFKRKEVRYELKISCAHLKDEGSLSPILLKVRTTVISTAQCQRYFRNADHSNICTSGGRSGGSCQVNSPLNYFIFQK